jgi:uracil-DNA glycosylase family 4
MNAEGAPGGVLVISDYPGDREDQQRRPFVGSTGNFLRYMLKNFWTGPVAFDNALRCMPKLDHKEQAIIPQNGVSKCRGYLRQTIIDAQPERIIAMGGRAIQSVFSEAVPVFSARHAIGWMHNDGNRIPVFLMPNPVNALKNHIHRSWITRDLKWALTCDIDRLTVPPYDETCEIIETKAESEEAVETFYDNGGMTFDCETAGRMFDDFFRMLCIGACAYGTEHAYIWDEAALADPEIAEPLLCALSDRNLEKNGSNVKYDVNAVRCSEDIEPQGVTSDVRLMRKMLYSNVSGYLEHMAYLVAMGGHKLEMDQALSKACKAISNARAQDKKGKAAGFLPFTENPIIVEAVKHKERDTKTYAFGLVNKDLLARYCAADVVVTDRLRRWQKPQLEKQKPIQRLWNKHVKDATEAFAQVEAWGIPASADAMRQYDKYLGVRIKAIDKRFERYGASPTSSPQMSDLLYNRLNLPCAKESHTGSGAKSTDKSALKRLVGKHPIVQDLIDHRALVKLRGTYAGGLIDHIRDDGRIHPTLWIDGTETGRASCSDPGLHQIPRGNNDHAKLARGCFVALPGYKLMQLDFGQLEYRVAAMLSGDPEMKAAFATGIDFHLRTAQLVSKVAWGIEPEECTKIHRSWAKNVNFGLLYGMTLKGLAMMLGCSIDEAEIIKEAIQGKFAVCTAWAEEQKEIARRTGYIWTYWDGEPARRRPLPNIASNDPGKQNNCENAAVNTPVQGTASEYCVRSLIECVNWIKRESVPAELVLTVHDSLMFHYPEEHGRVVAKGAHKIMTSHYSGGIDLLVDIEEGDSWGGLQSYDGLKEAA